MFGDHSVQANSSPRLIRVKITEDGSFVPNYILLKQNEGVVFRVTAHRSDELTWPPGVLHGFYLMYDNIITIKETIRADDQTMTKKTIEVKWRPLFSAKFTLRCPYHKHKTGDVVVRQW